MTFPGFAAEASLYKTNKHYDMHNTTANTSIHEAVCPQLEKICFWDCRATCCWNGRCFPC